ncbi:MAG: hypothetical protein ACLQAN_05660 [Acidimicrobiales bacterium]
MPTDSVSPPGATTPRRRHDLVAWVALGLVVATALTLVARESVAPIGRVATTTHSRQHVTSSPKTTPSARLTASGRPHRHARPHPKLTAAHPVPTTAVTPTPSTAPASTTPSSTSRVSSPQGGAPPAATTSGLSGVLRYPGDIATTFPFASPSGIASVRALWSGGEALEMTLGCGQAVTSGAGTHGISLVVAGHPGSCTVSIAFGPGQHGAVPYTLDVRVPPANPTAAGAP